MESSVSYIVQEWNSDDSDRRGGPGWKDKRARESFAGALQEVHSPDHYGSGGKRRIIKRTVVDEVIDYGPMPPMGTVYVVYRWCADGSGEWVRVSAHESHVDAERAAKVASVDFDAQVTVMSESRSVRAYLGARDE